MTWVLAAAALAVLVWSIVTYEPPPAEAPRHDRRAR